MAGDPRRRPGRHVHDARGHRRPRGRHRGARHLAGDQPRRRDLPHAAAPRGGARGRAGGGRPRLRSLLAGHRGARCEALPLPSRAALPPPDLRCRPSRHWSAQDPDPATRAEAGPACSRAPSAGDERAVAELDDAFGGRLEFGTAGLRGALGPGPSRMNRVVVGQAAAGLAAYLRDQGCGRRTG